MLSAIAYRCEEVNKVTFFRPSELKVVSSVLIFFSRKLLIYDKEITCKILFFMIIFFFNEIHIAVGFLVVK